MTSCSLLPTCSKMLPPDTLLQGAFAVLGSTCVPTAKPEGLTERLAPRAHTFVTIRTVDGQGALVGRQYLLQAIVVLEAARQESDFNFQIKLLLMSIYSALGAFYPLANIFDSLDTKTIQVGAVACCTVC